MSFGSKMNHACITSIAVFLASCSSSVMSPKKPDPSELKCTEGQEPTPLGVTVQMQQGRYNEVYKWECRPRVACPSGEDVQWTAERRPLPGGWENVSHECVNLAKEEADKKAEKAAEAAKEREWREAHPEEARLKDCTQRCVLDMRTQCSMGNMMVDAEYYQAQRKRACCQDLCERKAYGQ